jgi:CRP/FNR family cyclic AMP-dependent transcriptional regulator
VRTQPYGFERVDSCLKCTWRRKGFFCDLAPAPLKTLDAITFTNVYPVNSVLFSEGQTPRGVFVMCRGTAKLSISSKDGKTLITKIVAPGEVLGMSGSISGHPYKTKAETLEVSQVNFISRVELLHLLETHHQASLNAARTLALECEADADHIRALELSHSATERLASLILSWCPPDQKPCRGCRVPLLMTHEDLSQLIGSSRETVTRILKMFREKKLIAIKGSTLTILNAAALEGLAQDEQA